MNPDLLAILVCPITRTPLAHDPENNLLVARAANLAYPITDGVPVLLAEAARPWVAPSQGGLAPLDPPSGA
jgi:hypothetical protein